MSDDFWQTTVRVTSDTRMAQQPARDAGDGIVSLNLASGGILLLTGPLEELRRLAATILDLTDHATGEAS